jgi:hypothetical protein
VCFMYILNDKVTHWAAKGPVMKINLGKFINTLSIWWTMYLI